MSADNAELGRILIELDQALRQRGQLVESAKSLQKRVEETTRSLDLAINIAEGRDGSDRTPRRGECPPSSDTDRVLTEIDAKTRLIDRHQSYMKKHLPEVYARLKASLSYPKYPAT